MRSSRLRWVFRPADKGKVSGRVRLGCKDQTVDECPCSEWFLRIRNIRLFVRSRCRPFPWLEAFLKLHADFARRLRSTLGRSRRDRESYPTPPCSALPREAVPWPAKRSIPGRKKCGELPIFGAV